MLFTVTTPSSSAHAPATDLGYLLEKSPFRTQAFELSLGRAHLTFPEAAESSCTAALHLELGPPEVGAPTQMGVFTR